MNPLTFYMEFHKNKVVQAFRTAYWWLPPKFIRKYA